MKKPGPEGFRKIQFPLLIAFATVPLPLMIVSSFVSRPWLCVGAVAAAYVLLAILCLFIPGRVRLPSGLAGAAVILAVGAFTLPVREHAFLFVVPVLYAVLLLVGLPMAAWPRERETPALWLAVGVVLYGAAQVLISAGRRAGTFPGLLRAAPGLPVCLMAFLLLGLLSLNRAGMQDAGQGRHAVPRMMRVKNAALTVAFLALAAGIACIPGVVRALQALWKLFTQGVGRLAGWLMTLLPETPVQGGGGSGEGMADMAPLGEAAPPSPFLIVLERVIMVLALIALAVGAIFAVKFLIGRIRRLVRFLRDRLRRFAAAAAEDYVDEVTDTRDDAELHTRFLLNRLRLNLGSDRNLPPGRRIRRRYLRLRLRHGDWLSSRTARETLPPAAAPLYERARYSGHDMTEQDALDFERETRKV